jgi:hypothetical protein
VVCDGFCTGGALLLILQARKLLSQPKDFLLTGGWGGDGGGRLVQCTNSGFASSSFLSLAKIVISTLPVSFLILRKEYFFCCKLKQNFENDTSRKSPRSLLFSKVTYVTLKFT